MSQKEKDDPHQPIYNFHRFLRIIMMKKGIGFKQLSQESGVGVGTLYRWTSGVKPRDLIQVYSVAKALDGTIEELMFGFESNPRGNSYELVLYRISSDQLREKILTLPNP